VQVLAGKVKDGKVEGKHELACQTEKGGDLGSDHVTWTIGRGGGGGGGGGGGCWREKELGEERGEGGEDTVEKDEEGGLGKGHGR